MRIPDCDPVWQAECRQAEWDRKCAFAPRCSCCGGSVYPYDTYTEIGDFVFCERCVSFGRRYTDDLEV